MIYQNVVWDIALVGIGAVALGFLCIISQVGRSADADAVRDIHQRSERWRSVLFILLLIGFFAGSYATLHRFPIPPPSKS